MTFTEVIEDALKHYQDAAWLGESSPLATPYFLGDRLIPVTANALVRGRALQTLLQEATTNLQGKYAEGFQTILSEYYFRNRPAAVVWDQVGLGKNSFHLSRNAAIAALEEQLTEQMQPALRLEQPPVVEKLFERKRESEIALGALDKLQSVAILGINGIGKSAFAALLATKIDRPTFWYTVRLGLNDQLESLLFALGLFAHQQGSSTLWLALHTTPQQAASEQMLGVVRYTLTQIQPPPLLCFDQLEQLDVGQGSHHLPVISLLESLQGLVSMLWIGERVPLSSNEYISLGGLSLAVSVELLNQSNVPIAAIQHAEIYKLTKGNPRLLKLALASLSSGEAKSALPDDPALEAILNRTLARLPANERVLLHALAVYRTPAPMHPWQNRQLGPILNMLLEKQLLQSDGQGGVEVPLVYRQQIYRQLSTVERQYFHHQAAGVRAQSGAYTAAAYHWIEAGEIPMALAQWRTHQQREIAQGQATAAYTIFKPLITEGQSAAIREQAMLLCGQIDMLHGQSERVLRQFSDHLPATKILAVETGELLGMAANDQSEFDHAGQVFEQSLQVAEALVEVRMARLHKGRAWNHLRQRQLDLAERELSFAHYEIENMRGNLAFDRGLYAQAHQHYEAALRLAEELTNQDGIGKTSNNLAAVSLWQGAFEDATQHLERAFHAYESLGKVADMAGCCITQAVTHSQSGDYQSALRALDRAEKLLMQLGIPNVWQQVLIAQARAEAYLGAGDIVQAEAAVKVAIESEDVSILPDAYRVYGEISSQQGKGVAAENYLRKSLNLAQENDDRYLAAYAWRALAKYYQTANKGDLAGESITRAIDLFHNLGLPHEVEKCKSLRNEKSDHALSAEA